MTDTSTVVIGLACVTLGVVLILAREGVGRRAAALYRKIGINVPDHQYARQFRFIGVLLIILGALVVTGLFRYI